MQTTCGSSSTEFTRDSGFFETQADWKLGLQLSFWRSTLCDLCRLQVFSHSHRVSCITILSDTSVETFSTQSTDQQFSTLLNLLTLQASAARSLASNCVELSKASRHLPERTKVVPSVLSLLLNYNMVAWPASSHSQSSMIKLSAQRSWKTTLNAQKFGVECAGILGNPTGFASVGKIQSAWDGWSSAFSPLLKDVNTFTTLNSNLCGTGVERLGKINSSIILFATHTCRLAGVNTYWCSIFEMVSPRGAKETYINCN